MGIRNRQKGATTAPRGKIDTGTANIVGRAFFSVPYYPDRHRSTHPCDAGRYRKIPSTEPVRVNANLDTYKRFSRSQPIRLYAQPVDPKRERFDLMKEGPLVSGTAWTLNHGL